MKKILYIVLAALSLSLGLSSCGSKEKTEDSAATQQKPLEIVANPAGSDTGIVELRDPDLYTPGKGVERLTIIDFNAKWCGPCRQLTPVFEEAQKEFAGQATFVSCDIDSVPEVMMNYKLGNSIPVVLFIYPDGSTRHYVGTGDLLPYEKLSALITAALKKSR